MSKFKRILIIPIVAFLCQCTEGPGTEAPLKEMVTVEFQNTSSYTADVFRNINLGQCEPSVSPLITVQAGTTKTVQVEASEDQESGDTLYFRYKVLFDYAHYPNGEDIYISMMRTVDHVPEVLEAGKKSYIQINQPNLDELATCRAYLEIANLSNEPFYVVLATTRLQRINDTDIVSRGETGYYELPGNPPAEIVNLKISSNGKNYAVSPFTVEKTMLYKFRFTGSLVLSEDPFSEDIR